MLLNSFEDIRKLAEEDSKWDYHLK
jgi:hypothetical protein